MSTFLCKILINLNKSKLSQFQVYGVILIFYYIEKKLSAILMKCNM